MEKVNNKVFIVVIIVLVLGAVLLWSSGMLTAEESSSLEKIEVRWLIAHEPVELFENATKEFARVLSEESGGEMTLTVLTASDIDTDVGIVGDVPVSKVLALLESGDIELSTTLAAGANNYAPQFLEINLPFLFDNYDDAFETFDGPSGKKLLSVIEENTNNIGLAFTLSGGFRVLASQKDLELNSIEDFKGKIIITTAGVVGEEIFKQLGATALSTPDDIDKLPSVDEIDAVEVTYSRIAELENSTFIQYINETNHSLFLTVMLTSKDFFNSLSPKNQSAFLKAVKIAAEIEREDSVALNKEVKQKLKDDGVIIREISPEMKESFKEAVRPVYDWFETTIGTRIIK